MARWIMVLTTKGLPLGKATEIKSGVMLTREMVDGALVDTWKSKRGGRINVYRGTAKGLTVKSTIHANQLPRRIHFSYTYR